MNVRLLEQVMRAQGVSNEDVARAIQKDVSTWIRKKKSLNGENITIGEIEIICNLLQLTSMEAVEVFLPSYSQKCEL